MWTISTYDVRLEEGDETFLAVTPPEGTEDEGIDQLLVLVESLEGRSQSFEASVEVEEGIEFSYPRAARQVFFGSLHSLGRAVVKLRALVTGFFRVTIARLKKHLTENWNELPCDVCKKMAKTLTRAILAWFGIGMPTDFDQVVDSLVDLNVRALWETLKKSGFWDWIVQSGLEALAAALLTPILLFARKIRATEEWIYIEACTAVGACRPT